MGGVRFLLKTGMEIPLAVPLLNEELGKGHAYPFCHVPHKKTCQNICIYHQKAVPLQRY